MLIGALLVVKMSPEFLLSLGGSQVKFLPDSFRVKSAICADRFTEAVRVLEVFLASESRPNRADAKRKAQVGGGDNFREDGGDLEGPNIIRLYI